MTPAKRLTLAQPTYAFVLTWSGQLISLVGSGLTTFAISVQVYQDTGSITRFSLVAFFSALPTMVLSPIAGALVDRWDRRKVMLYSDLGAGFGTLAIWLLLVAAKAGRWQIQPWHFYGPIALGSACVAFRWPAQYATTSLLVPKRHLGRANGLLELANGAGLIAAPVVAAVLVTRIGTEGVVLIDLATFAFALVTLLIVRFPQPPPSAEGQAGKGSVWREAAYGWAFIRTRPGLLRLVLFVAVMNMITGLLAVLITPLVLSFADIPTLGLIQSAAGLGILAGGVVMSVWGGPRRRIRGIIGFHALSGCALFLAAFPASVLLISIGASLVFFTIPLVASCAQAIWQAKVAPDLQGRVFSMRRMISLAAPPVAALLAGPLADGLFEPWLRPGGALAGTVGKVVGTGPGRGIALLCVALGLLAWLNALVAYLSPRVRNVEDELPEALHEERARSASAAPSPATEVDSPPVVSTGAGG